jgi:hypothetical protein
MATLLSAMPTGSAATRAALSLFALALASCSREPPLAPELQAVRCPVNRTAHASATFAKARITFVCLGKEMADAPHLLRCDLESRPMVCEDDGMLLFSRGPGGEVYAGPGPKEFRDMAGAPGTYGGSELRVRFTNAPERITDLEEEETDWKFLLRGGRNLLPPGFTLVRGVVCDRGASVLNTGACVLQARSNSLFWHISVWVRAEQGTPITAEEYRAELEAFRDLLAKVVKDPAKA